MQMQYKLSTECRTRRSTSSTRRIMLTKCTLVLSVLYLFWFRKTDIFLLLFIKNMCVFFGITINIRSVVEIAAVRGKNEHFRFL